MTGAGSMNKVGTGQLTLTGANLYAGGTTISGGTLQLGNGTTGNDGSLSATGGINDNGMLTFNLAGSETYAGVISGAGRMTKSGSGTLILNQANTFTGLTTINLGTIVLANSGALQGSTLVVPTSTAAVSVFSSAVAGNAFTLGGLSGAGNLSLSNSADVDIALTVGANNSSTTFSGTLGDYENDGTGSGQLIKVGSGALTLTGQYDPSFGYGGGTIINGGALVVPTSENIPFFDTASLTVNAGATLTLSATGWAASDVNSLLNNSNVSFAAGSMLAIDTSYKPSFTYRYSINGSMGLTVLGTNALVLIAANNLTGPVIISGGTLQLGDGTNGDDGSFSATAGIINNGTLAYDLYGPQTDSFAISGSGNLTKAGSDADPRGGKHLLRHDDGFWRHDRFSQ